MSKDPDELMNRAQNPLYIKITEELRHKLVEYLEKNGLHVGQKDGTWKKYGKNNGRKCKSLSIISGSVRKYTEDCGLYDKRKSKDKLSILMVD